MLHFNNPIPRSGLPRHHETSPLKSVNDSEVVPKLWQKTKTSTQQLYSVCQAVEQIQRQLNRLRRRSGGEPGEPGFHFAEPMEYDWLNGKYSKNEVVIVSPDSVAATLGINTESTEDRGTITGKDGNPHEKAEGEDQEDADASEDVATAGIWVCLRNPRVLSEEQPESDNAPRNYDVHVPVWPPPSAEGDAEVLNLTEVDEDDSIVDNPVNYWMLLGFIPIERTWCNQTTGEPEQFYVQAVKIPEPPDSEEEGGEES